MYKVYCDDQLIHRAGTELSLISGEVKLTENATGLFTFVIAQTHPFYDSILPFKTLIRVLRDEEEIFRGRCISYSTDFYNTKTVVCEGEAAYMIDSIQPQRTYKQMSARNILTEMLKIHNGAVDENAQIEVGIVTVDSGELYDYQTEYDNTFNAVRNFAEAIKAHFIVDRDMDGKRKLNLTRDYPRTTQAVRLGQNMLDYAADKDYANIASIIIPLGAKTSAEDGAESYVDISSVNNGRNYIASEELIAQYGKITQVVKFDDIENPLELKKKGEAYMLEQYVPLSLSVTAVDMSVVDVNINTIRLGDSVRVVSKPYNLDMWFPVRRRYYNILNPAADKLELGDKVDNKLTDKITQSNKDILDKINKLPSRGSIVTEALENAKELLNYYADKGHISYTPSEMLIMDTEDKRTAKNIWRWNLGGLAHYPNGYNGTPNVAITMDGHIAGEMIKGGSITADKISTPNLEALSIKMGSFEIVENGLLYNGKNGQMCYVSTPYAWQGDGTPFFLFMLQENGGNFFTVDYDGNVKIRGSLTVNGKIIS